jgi:single-strand DNA-binding protein
MYQKITLLGHVGTVEDMRYAKDIPVVNFSIATSEGKGNAKVTEWWRCVAWDKLAGVVEQYVRKGDRLFVEGVRQTRTWRKEDGTEVEQWQIRVLQLRLLGDRPAAAAATVAAEAPARAANPPRERSTSAPARDLTDDDDIPF